MTRLADPKPETTEQFSPLLFIGVNSATLVGLLSVVRLGFPAVWAEQIHAGWGPGAVAFVAISLVNSFIEYFLHRYVLHTPAVPWVRRLYRQHTLHHGLTHIGLKRMPDGRGILFVENRFPIVEEHQGEAAFFPWYSLAVFAAIISPGLALLQWVLPHYPWFMAGYLSLSTSLVLYEGLHALNHLPFEKWAPLIADARWGGVWRRAYGFHLRHHAVTDCNESISGFFGLPITDWIFGTCILPRTLYASGEEWKPEDFRSPRPRKVIRWLDARAAAAVERRRERAAQLIRSSTAKPARPEVALHPSQPAHLPPTGPHRSR